MPSTCAQVLVYLGLPTGVLLLGASAIRERAGLLENGLSLVAAKPAHYAVAVLMGFLVNLSTAFAIKVTGSLTFKVRHGLCCHCYSLCLPYSLWEGVVMLQFCMLTYYDGLSVPALSAEGSAQKMLCLYSWGAGVGGARRMLHETMLKSHAGGGLREEHAAGVGGRAHGRCGHGGAAGGVHHLRARLRAVHARQDAGGCCAERCQEAGLRRGRIRATGGCFALCILRCAGSVQRILQVDRLKPLSG